MKNIYFLTILLLIGSCASSNQVTSTYPDLIELSSLPPYHDNMSLDSDIRLGVYFYVLKDGTIGEVRIVNSSGYPDWDSEAKNRMALWRFAEPDLQNEDEGLWVPKIISLVIRDEEYMSLGELIAFNEAEADSLFALLVEGKSFHDLANEYWQNNTRERGQYKQNIDLNTYPEHVRLQLRKLRVNRYSAPIPIGNRYVIFMRYDPDSPLVSVDVDP